MRQVSACLASLAFPAISHSEIALTPFRALTKNGAGTFGLAACCRSSIHFRAAADSSAAPFSIDVVRSASVPPPPPASLRDRDRRIPKLPAAVFTEVFAAPSVPTCIYQADNGDNFSPGKIPSSIEVLLRLFCISIICILT